MKKEHVSGRRHGAALELHKGIMSTAQRLMIKTRGR